MRDLDLWLFSARLRATFLVALGCVVFGGASAAVAIGAPQSFQSARGRQAMAPRQADPGTLTDGRAGQAAVIQPAITITKVVRRDQTPRGERHVVRYSGGPVAADCTCRGRACREPSVLVANAANITRLCRYLL